MKSFSARAKDAVARADDFDKLKSCCRRAELTGFALGCGTPVLVGGEGVCFCMRTEHAASARRAVQIIRAEFAEQPVLRIVRAARLGGRTAFEVRLTAECTRKVLHGCDISFSEMTIPKHCLLKKCCRASFLRGLFLACGTIAAPESGYQMEFLLAGGRTAESVMRFLRAFCGIRAGVAERKGADIVYIRDSESLIRLLSMIGANAAILDIENVRIMKDARNRANRAANCDAANIAKVVGTADRNLRSIEKIRQTVGLQALPDALREIAVLRAEHAEATLEELGAMLVPPLGKSGVFHRLRRLDDFAASLERKETEANHGSSGD